MRNFHRKQRRRFKNACALLKKEEEKGKKKRKLSAVQHLRRGNGGSAQAFFAAEGYREERTLWKHSRLWLTRSLCQPKTRS